MSSAADVHLGAPRRAEDLALFHATLADLCRAELPLPRALRMLAADVSGPLAAAARSLADDVERGAPLSEAYRRHQDRFPPLYAALLDAGIAAGDLPGVLDEIARHASVQAEASARMRRALAYPLVSAVFVAIVGVAALAVATPRLWSVGETLGTDSPAPYAFGALGILGALILAAFGWAWARGTGVPVFGRLRRTAARATTATTLAVLLRRGLPLSVALRLTAEATDDARLRAGLAKGAGQAEGGAPLQRVLEDGDVFDPALAWLVAHAAGRGEGPRALDDAADIYRRRLARGVDRVTTLVTPVAELIVGAAVCVFAYSYLIPMFQWADSILGG